MEWIEFKHELKDFIERLDLKGHINRNPKPIVAFSIIVFFLFLAVVVSMLSDNVPPPVARHDSEWYYDLNTSKLFTAEEGLTPPIDAPSGPLADGSPAGVRAHVFTHVKDPNESQYFIGFLETADPNAPPGGTKLIRRLRDPNWVPADSPDASAIITEAFTPDANGESPSQYYPQN